jgi:hypothetical protein
MYEFETLSSRKGFNRSLGHFRTVSSLIDDFESHTNLADILNEALNEKEIEHQQITPIVHALLVDKYNYCCESLTVPETISDFSYIVDEVKNWKAVDITLLYFHPDLGPMVFNPKNKDHFENINTMTRNELLNIYVGSFEKSGDPKNENKALETVVKLFSGKKIKTPDQLLKGSFAARPKKKSVEKAIPAKGRSAGRQKGAPANKRAASQVSQKKEAAAEPVSSGKRRMTPFYSVPVTNELFHNGNVEAWKRVIQSYNNKHPDLEVYIYYEGERIHDIHSLFKWGKVKHGSAILFAVAGEEIKDVAKLQRYLKQGASPKFEEFLKFPISQILNLF